MATSVAPVTAILLIDHGSRRTEAHEQLVQLGKKLEARLAQGSSSLANIVEVAHMEVTTPDIDAGFARCVARGARHVIAIPCLLSRGKHVQEDIPRLLDEAGARFPGVSKVLSAPLVEHEGFLDLLLLAAQSTRDPIASQ